MGLSTFVTRFHVWPNVGMHFLARVYFVAHRINQLIASNRVLDVPVARPFFAVCSPDDKIAPGSAIPTEVTDKSPFQPDCCHAHYAPTTCDC